MGDGLKLAKDKRHRSSSSLVGTLLEGTRSERKLEIRASIPEVEDQFALAEARCDDLQEKIDMVKVMKRKKKLKKRSMTRVVESPAPENVPFITVRTQPKKNLLITEVATEPRRRSERRSYLDPATLEQHRMLNQVFRGPNSGRQQAGNKMVRSRIRRAQADGDVIRERNAENASHEVACGDDEQEEDDYAFDTRFTDEYSGVTGNTKELEQPIQMKHPSTRRRLSSKDTVAPSGQNWSGNRHEWRNAAQGKVQIRHMKNKQLYNNGSNIKVTEERPVVELFNNSRSTISPVRRQPQRGIFSLNNNSKQREATEDDMEEEDATGPLERDTIVKEKQERHPRRVRYRTHRYELPTVSSQMKQSTARVPIISALPPHNIPFVVSKSTEPSHNVGVNLQQVLNGLKIQQPLSRIPLTIAHHMGLGHIPAYGARSLNRKPAVGGECMNAIWVSGRVLRVPSRKCMSYSRLLAMYREGDGIVPRFLRAIARPHYFYTSMYNLPTHREDFDGATSKGRGGSQEAKQSLAEYASLYREFERVEKSLSESHEPELERRRDELARQLASKEEHIRKVVQDYRLAGEEGSTLRASASTADEAYRHSSYRVNEDSHQ